MLLFLIQITAEMDRESMDELVKSVDDGVLIHLLYVILAEFQERFYRYRQQALASASAVLTAASEAAGASSTQPEVEEPEEEERPER